MYFALAWYILLCSGLDFGQLLYGLKVVMPEAADKGDIGRIFAHSGTAVLTAVPVRLGGVAGILGCMGLILRVRWALIPLVMAALLLAWPILVWIVTLSVWHAIDSMGSLMLLVHTIITVMVAFGLPVLAMLTGWDSKS